MTPELDTAKLEQLFADLGRNKTFLVELVATYRAQFQELTAHAECGASALADTVHKMAGSSAMFAPSSMVQRLTSLEQALRSDRNTTPLLEETLAHLRATVGLVEEWIWNLPESSIP